MEIDIKQLIDYIEDHNNNFLGSRATLKEQETFEFMYDQLMMALERQIPKKPDFAGGRYVCKCGWDIYRDRQKYCLNCGCKLKWEEGE